MKLEIKKPDWLHKCLPIGIQEDVIRLNVPQENEKVNYAESSEHYLNRWFDEHVEPVNKLLREGVEAAGPI